MADQHGDQFACRSHERGRRRRDAGEAWVQRSLRAFSTRPGQRDSSSFGERLPHEYSIRLRWVEATATFLRRMANDAITRGRDRGLQT